MGQLVFETGTNSFGVGLAGDVAHQTLVARAVFADDDDRIVHAGRPH